MASDDYCGKPYKIVDSKREHKIGIVASSLTDFMTKAQQKLDITEPIKVVLESDGTEIDEDDYFDTLEKNTLIMILKPEEKWCSYSDISIKLADDQVDGSQSLYNLIQRLKNDIGQIALLGGCDLELLSDMDPDNLVDMAFDRSFLDQIKEASGRFLYEKREAQDALNLLKLYHASTIGQNPSKKMYTYSISNLQRSRARTLGNRQKVFSLPRRRLMLNSESKITVATSTVQ